MDEYIGIIKIFAGNFAPRGWQFCQGQTLNIAQNSALYSLLGIVYGGNGTTTFNLPDLSGRVPVGQGTGAGLQPITQGQKGGIDVQTLTSAQMPTHTHAVTIAVSIPVNADGANSDSPEGAYMATSGSSIYASTASGAFAGSPNVTAAAGYAGSNMPFDNRSPFLGLNYIICMEGYYPTRP